MRCSTSSYLLLVSLCQQPLCQQLEHVWSFLILHYKPFPLHCLTLQICQMQAMVVDPFHFNKLWINSFCFSHLCGPDILSVFLQKPPALLILGWAAFEQWQDPWNPLVPCCSSVIKSASTWDNGNIDRLLFLGSKITADDDCSREIKRHLLLERKAMTNLDSVLKSRDITLPTKVCIVEAMVFPVVIYGHESWSIKKAGHRRTDASELWCWRRLLRVPWTAKRSNQPILKEISPKYSLEGLMLKLKLQCLGYLMWRVDSLEKTLILGKIEGRRWRGRQKMR